MSKHLPIAISSGILGFLVEVTPASRSPCAFTCQSVPHTWGEAPAHPSFFLPSEGLLGPLKWVELPAGPAPGLWPGLHCFTRDPGPQYEPVTSLATAVPTLGCC